MPGAGGEIGIFPPVQPFAGCFGIFAWWPFCHRIAPRSNRVSSSPRERSALIAGGAALLRGVSKDGRTSDHPSRLAQERARTSSDNGEAVARG
jgi:hypothetical protein